MYIHGSHINLHVLYACHTHIHTKAELFNSFNNNGPGQAEDVQHGSDHSLDSDDNINP